MSPLLYYPDLRLLHHLPTTIAGEVKYFKADPYWTKPNSRKTYITKVNNHPHSPAAAGQAVSFEHAPLANPAIGERGVLQGQRQCQWDSLQGSLAIGEGFHEDNKIFQNAV